MNQNGQSLIQVLVAVGIMSLIATGMASMMSSQGRENRALSEKLAGLELGRSVTQFLSSDKLCKTIFDPTNVMDAAELYLTSPGGISPSNPYKIGLKGIGLPPENVLATQGNTVSHLSSTLRILPTTGIEVSLTSMNSATLNIRFDQNNLVRPIQNLSFPITLTTDSPAVPTRITGCQGTGSGNTQKVTNISIPTTSGGYVNCTAGTVDSAPVSYVANGDTLVISANIEITAGDDCAIAQSLVVNGPGLNAVESFANVGNNVNGGNFTVNSNRQMGFNVQPGGTYSILVRRQVSNNGGGAVAQAWSDTALLIQDF